MIIGNKLDLENDRAVDKDEAEVIKFQLFYQPF